MMIVKHLYISGINKTNYVCIYAWIDLQQHMVIRSMARLKPECLYVYLNRQLLISFSCYQSDSLLFVGSSKHKNSKSFSC